MRATTPGAGRLPPQPFAGRLDKLHLDDDVVRRSAGVTLEFDPIDEAGRQWAAHFDARFVSPMEAITSVMRVQQLWLARLNEALAPHGLTFARYEALMLLYFSRAGALPLGKIGSRLQVHPASVTNLIDGLERDGLVERVAHPSDRRTTLATITESGRGRARAATGELHAIRFGTLLPESELDTITEILRRARVEAGDFEPAPHAVPPST
jgi:DNA-binding MarR family transcriptional regulator